ncbi:hypothetical protein EDEG_03411 [Edhazardia aedis USNM 41457]|uniref:SLC26A/SulP transporter domain-containing protein n=1 Tax=Edhazardia aedis (strain USNM 41457) TaxID=1003232 RepID=J8ZR33_EDHAE|nr:hypothetical protein EDEG_03411 [Edhazardia aedis USNM 41457]|eukprot:EJW02143.1 hypothetical protein EDEG_03411 [Edhazardia aedis USNM 41457]
MSNKAGEQKQNENLRIKITALISCLLLGFIFCLMDSITYGRNILNGVKKFESESEQLESISFQIYLTSTILAQAVFAFFTKIDSGILATFIVESVDYYQKIFINISTKTDDLPTAVTNTLICVSISTFLFACTSFGLLKLNLGKYLAYIPKSALCGGLGAIGISQFKVAFQEIGFDISDIKISQKIVVTLGLVILIAIVGFYLSEKFSDSPLVIPVYTVGVVIVFYLIGLITVGTDISKLRDNGWLPKKSTSSFEFQHVKNNLSLRSISFKYIFDNLFFIFTLTAVNLIHLPLNTATYTLATGIKADFGSELFTQCIGNFFTMFSAAPTYFVCSNSIFFRKSGGKTKLSGILMALPILILYKFGLKIKSFIPPIVLASFPVFFGLSFCYSAFYSTFKTLKKFGKIDYLILVATAIIATMVGFVEGIAAGLIFNFFVFIKSYNNSIRDRKVVKIIDDAVVVDYILFFGNLHRFLQTIDKLAKVRKYIVIDFTACHSIDWLSRDSLIDKISETSVIYHIIGQKKHFEDAESSVLITYHNYEDYETKYSV